MSIVGAAGVRLEDLTSLGIPTLSAMASGKMKSVAPSYMVLAALKALTDGQKSQQVPEPQGTVKDAVIAQATPPAPPQAGIGAMLPQGFAEGGSVDPEEDRQKLLKLWEAAKNGSKEAGAALMDFATMGSRGVLGAYNSTILRGLRAAGVPIDYVKDVEGGDFSSMTPYYDKYIKARATEPTSANTSIDNRPSHIGAVSGVETIQNTPQNGSQQPRPVVSTSVKSGISSTGINPVGKYVTPKLKEYNVNPIVPKDLNSIPDLNIPQPTNLQAALAKYGAPDEQRLAELKSMKENAMLSSLARGIGSMKYGRGLGAVFGQAAADATDSGIAADKERQAYQDRREQTALGLGLHKDASDLARFTAQQGFKQGERSFDTEIQGKNTDTALKSARYSNEDVLNLERIQIEHQKMQIQSAAQRVAAEIRRDGLNEANQAKKERLYQTAKEVAIKEAESVFGKTDVASGMANPKLLEQKQAMIENVFSREIARLNDIFGRDSAGQTPVNGPKIRGTFPGK